MSSVKRYNVTLYTHDAENRHLLLRQGAWCVCSSCDKRSRWSEVMYQLQLRLCVATGLAWEGLRGGCLVTTNLLKCLMNMRGRALFWQWIVKSAFYSVFSSPWTAVQHVWCHTRHAYHDSHLRALKLVLQDWPCVCVCVCVLPEECVFSDCLRWIPATITALLALSACFSYSGLSSYDPRSCAKIQAVFNESRAPAV